MTIYLKAIVCVLVTVILCITLSKYEKNFSLLLSIAVCCLVGVTAFGFIEPVISFVNKLEEFGHLDHHILSILIKAVAIGFLSEFTSMICTDAGNGSLGKIIKFLGSSVILWLSLPLLNALLDMLDNVLVNT